MKTTRMLKNLLLITLLMGLGTAWGQNTTQGPNDCIKMTNVRGNSTVVTYYQRLTTKGGITGALNAAGGTDAGTAGSRRVCTIELLWPDDQVTDQYTLDNMITYNRYYKDIIIKTAEGSSFKATIKRGNYGVNQGMLVLSTNSGTLSLENIILDGMNIQSSVAGAVIGVSNGTVSIGTGAVLQNGNTSGNGGLVNVSAGALNINGATLQNGNAANGAIINKAGAGALSITGSVLNGDAATSTLINDAGSGALTFSGCTINGSTTAANNTLVRKSSTGAVTFTNTTITRNQSQGYGFITTSTGTVTFDGCTINGSNNTSATASLIKTNTGVLSLTNTTVTGHTVSTANICAVDASAADGGADIKIYTGTSIIGNTSNNRPANLKISGTNYMYIYNPLTQDIGITNTNNNYNDAQFGYSNPTTSIGVQHLINDITDMLTPTQSGHVIKWVADDSADPLDDMFGFPDYLIHDLKIYPTTSDLEAVPEGALIGNNNEDPTLPYMVWKSVTYNADNSADITLNYFQKQVNLKLDFIFVIDETTTMGSSVSANGYSMSQARWARSAALEASKGVLQLNVDYPENNNNNRVCFISWGDSDLPIQISDFLDNYADASEAIDYDVIGGGDSDSHSRAITAATTTAAQSRNSGHQPIVVYLSDYHGYFDNVTDGTINLLKEQAELIYPFCIFDTYTDTRRQRMNRLAPEYYHHYTQNHDDPSELITPFIDIIHDAVAHCGNGLVVEDVLANGLVAAAAANGVTSSDGTGSYGTTNAVINDNGTETWQLLNDAADDNRLYTGHMYSKIINVPMTDDVYSGAMPTNNGLTLENDGVEVNRIDDSPLLSKSITLVLKGDNASGAALGGATFTLEHGSNTWNLTSDANGQIILPWGENDGTNTFAFKPNDEYTLTQLTTIDGYVRPGGSWTLSVGSEYKITSTATQGTGNVNRTRDMVAVGGMFEIYNDSEPTLTYVPNGGEGSQIVVTIDFENNETSHPYTTLTAAQSSFTFGDRTLTEWNTSGDGSGTSYGLGANITLSRGEDGNISLYAQWSGEPIIARVSNDNGATWTMHSYLINSSGTGTNQGAFNFANTLSGDVIIETLLETAIIGGADRYALNQGFTFNNAKITSLTLRTTPDAQWNPATDRFTSIITKNQTTKSMISVTSAIPSLSVENLIFDGGGDNGYSGTEGGLFYVESDDATFTDCDFVNSKVKGNCNGGAISYNNSEQNKGTIKLYGCVFNNCQAPTGSSTGQGNGGALYINRGMSAIISKSSTRRSSFTSCMAKRYGGAAMFEDNFGSNLLVEYTDFTSCSATDRDGGAVYSDAQATSDIATTIKDCSFTSCSAKQGSAIALNCDLSGFNGTNSIYNSTFTSCSTTGNGGAIYSHGSNATLTITDCNFSACQSTNGSGGAIYTKKALEIKIDASGTSSFIGCTAKTNGGAIYAGGDFTLSEYAQLTLGGTQTGEGCSAGTGNGGGVYCGGKFIAPQGSIIEITNCTANEDGGGVYAYSGLEIDGEATFTNCTATRNGGGIYTPQSCLLTHQYNPSNPSLTLENCHAGASGGGAYFKYGIHTTWDAPSSSINPATITATGCTAGVNGGGFYLSGGVDLYGDPATTGCYITGCSAGTGKGGGIYLNCTPNFAGLIIVEGNTHGTGDNTVADDVYIDDQSAKYINIDVDYGLDCASHIGIYKDDGYKADANGIYSTEIAEGTEEHCQQAVNGKLLFDDRNLYGTFHFDYIGTNPQNDFLTYALGKVYFVPSWEAQAALAVENTDYKLADGYVSEVLTNRGMAFFAKDVNLGEKDYAGKTVTLKDNIDLGGSYWTPISSSARAATDCSVAAVPETRFKGTFNGNGYVISNLLSILPYKHMGLFGYVEGGTITNTFVHGGYLENTHIPSSQNAECTTGGLVGYLDQQGTVTYSEAALRLNGENPNYGWPKTGGLVGYVYRQSTIHSCMAMPEIVSDNAHDYNGGLVGELLDGSVINCFAYPKFNVVGVPMHLTYSTSVATLGGLIGGSEENVTVSNCYVRMQEGSEMNGEYHFGTLDGETDEGDLNHCYIPTGESYFCCESTRVPTESGKFSPTALVNDKYGFRHSDQLVDETPMVNLLNDWVKDNDGQGYARWSRTMASPINGDYPVLLLPGSVCITSTDNVFLEYHPELNDQIVALNGTEGGGSIYLYDANPTAINTNTDDDVRVYIHEDVGLLQADGNNLNARVGVTLKNARDESESDPNWHTFSSALNNAPTGIVYHTREDASYIAYNQTSIPDSDFNNTTYMDPPKTTWNTTSGSIGYFPTNTPYGAWRGTEDSNGFFDCYAYSEPYYHWINLKREGSSSYMDHWHIDPDASGNHRKIDYMEEASNSNQLINGKGYLVALSAESMMMTDGQLNNGDVTVTLNKTEAGTNTPTGTAGEDAGWRSFNLVGNPYQSYLNFDLLYEESANEGLIDNSFAIRDDNGKQYLFYTYEASSNDGYTATNLIHPHQGFFVRVNDEKTAGSYPLTFTNAMRVSGNLAENHPFRGSHLNYPLVNLLCFDSQGHRDLTTIEVGRPELGGGHKMFKLVNGDARLYARLEGGSYQTLFTPTGVNEIPVCFEAQNDGSFKLQWNTLHGDFYYLHLIDNLTGADIDMLSTDEYRFEGRSSDYASRFKLVFRCTGVEEQYDNNNTGSETFAFIHDGQLVINGTGTLQVFDILGHQLLSKELSTANCQLPTANFPSGVYVLRLINGSNVKTQKLIINQ